MNIAKIGKIRPLVMLGIPDFFVPQATQAESYADLGLDAAGIEQRIQAVVNQ
ncbi:1-deoxy-D-xylulose-5-phosphate synthase [Actinobacillus equuli]|nr:1-deoxy-D-xylulose-5-phosphate synthase [Actinobacillus equuli]